MSEEKLYTPGEREIKMAEESMLPDQVRATLDRVATFGLDIQSFNPVKQHSGSVEPMREYLAEYKAYLRENLANFSDDKLKQLSGVLELERSNRHIDPSLGNIRVWWSSGLVDAVEEELEKRKLTS